MVNIEQVRLLESRVTKAIDYVNRLTDENTLLKSKLDDYQKRIGELETLVQRFKEDQARIEEGIVSALNHLNRFEDASEKPESRALNSAPVTVNEVPAPPPSAVPTAGGGAENTNGTLDDLSAAYTVDEELPVEKAPEYPAEDGAPALQAAPGAALPAAPGTNGSEPKEKNGELEIF